MTSEAPNPDVVSTDARGGFGEWWKEPARSYATGSMGKAYHALTAAQTGVYHRLLHHAWGPGLIPNDAEELALRTRFGVVEIESALPVLVERGLLRASSDGTHLYSPLLESMMRENVATKERQAEYGRQGGNAKHANKKTSGGEAPRDIPF